MKGEGITDAICKDSQMQGKHLGKVKKAMIMHSVDLEKAIDFHDNLWLPESLDPNDQLTSLKQLFSGNTHHAVPEPLERH